MCGMCASMLDAPWKVKNHAFFTQLIGENGVDRLLEESAVQQCSAVIIIKLHAFRKENQKKKNSRECCSCLSQRPHPAQKVGTRSTAVSFGRFALPVSRNPGIESRRVLRRVLETAFETVLRRVLRRCLAVGFNGKKGSKKGS